MGKTSVVSSMVSLSETILYGGQPLHQHGAIQVVALLVNLVFSMQFLAITASNSLEHLELFAGDCSVTRAEHMDRGGTNTFICIKPIPFDVLLNGIYIYTP